MTGGTETVPAANGSEKNTTLSPQRILRAAWRQHRFWVTGSVALVAAGGLALTVIVLLIPACASPAFSQTFDATCDFDPAETLWRLYRVALYGLPVLAGAVLGAVTFGPDKEHRTQIYALTQDVTRLRWWAAKVLITAGPVFIAAALLGTATLWVVSTSDNSIIWASRITSPNFDVLGLIPATRFLVAYAAAAAAALIWRTIGGVVAGLVVAGVVLGVTTVLLPVVAQQTRELIPVQAWDYKAGSVKSEGFYTVYNSAGFADSNGYDLDTSTLVCSDDDYVRCLQEVGVAYRVQTYVSDLQYPRVMLTMSGINFIIAGTFLAAGAQALRRRDVS